MKVDRFIASENVKLMVGSVETDAPSAGDEGFVLAAVGATDSVIVRFVMLSLLIVEFEIVALSNVEFEIVALSNVEFETVEFKIVE